MIDAIAVGQDHTVRYGLECCHHANRRRLSAAGEAEQAQELPVLCDEIQTRNCASAVGLGFGHALKLDASYFRDDALDSWPL